MSLKLVTPATGLPVALSDLLNHLRVDTSESDKVAFLAQVATEMVENYTNRSLLQKSYRYQSDGFPNFRTYWPSFRGYTPSENRPLNRPETTRSIELRCSPLVSITSVKYYAPGVLVQTVWDAANYYANSDAEPGKLCMVDGASIPDLDRRPDALQIEFVAGYAADQTQLDLVPPMLRQAVIFLTKHLYDNPDVVSQAGGSVVPYTAQHLLRAYRVDSLTPQ